jgi:hypothetical protein
MNCDPSLVQNAKRIRAAILLALTTLSAPVTLSSPMPHTVSAFCACCADRGVWSLEKREIRDYEMKELNRLSPNRADFYATDGWPADVSGVSAPENPALESGYFVVSIVREQQT